MMTEKKRKYRNEEHLNTVDFFVAGFKGDALKQAEYLQNKANQRKAEADEIERKRRAGKKNGV